MSVTTTGQDYLSMAIDIATTNVHNAGGPFGAVVVTADGQTFEGVNRVTANNDPSAHAEVVAIRTAAAALGTFDLSGCVLYSSCEPCPMCLATSFGGRPPPQGCRRLRSGLTPNPCGKQGRSR